MCEEQYMHNERVWKIRHGLINQFLLQALLLDDLWTSTCLVKTVNLWTIFLIWEYYKTPLVVMTQPAWLREGDYYIDQEGEIAKNSLLRWTTLPSQTLQTQLWSVYQINNFILQSMTSSRSYTVLFSHEFLITLSCFKILWQEEGSWLCAENLGDHTVSWDCLSDAPSSHCVTFGIKIFLQSDYHRHSSI